MKTAFETTISNQLVQQTNNNTTTWIGHMPGKDSDDIVGGQTFIAHAEGDLDNIQVYSSVVANPGKVSLTLHAFNTEENSWGAVLGSTSIEISKQDNDKWISFKIPGLHLSKGKTYGFKLESAESFIGVGEAAGSHEQPPFSEGQEWQFKNKEQKGNSFSYFSLAFKVGLRA